MELRIEHCIPAPKQETKFPNIYKHMKPGDSFVYPVITEKERKCAQTMYHTIARKLHIKITTRSVPGGLRIWKLS